MVEYNVGSYSEGKTLNSQMVTFFGWVTLLVLAVTVGSNLISGGLVVQLPYLGAVVSSVLGWILIVSTLISLIVSLFGRK